MATLLLMVYIHVYTVIPCYTVLNVVTLHFEVHLQIERLQLSQRVFKTIIGTSTLLHKRTSIANGQNVGVTSSNL